MTSASGPTLPAAPDWSRWLSSRRRAAPPPATALLRRRELLSASLVLAVQPCLAEPSPLITVQVFLDMSVDDVPLGRVVLGLFGLAAPLCAQRFLELASGPAGAPSLRRTLVDSLQPTFVRAAGVRRFTYAEAGAVVTTLTGGESASSLWGEADREGALLHDREGLLSLLVRPEEPPEPPKERLVAVRGQLVSVLDSPSSPPNGTGFALTLAAAPTLDGGIGVVVGTVLSGMDVVRAIAALPRNRNADEAGALFAVAKAAGDKRAAARGKASGRPLSKVAIAACGLVA